jgi:hypothetical protein
MLLLLIMLSPGDFKTHSLHQLDYFYFTALSLRSFDKRRPAQKFSLHDSFNFARERLMKEKLQIAARYYQRFCMQGMMALPG